MTIEYFAVLSIEVLQNGNIAFELSRDGMAVPGQDVVAMVHKGGNIPAELVHEDRVHVIHSAFNLGIGGPHPTIMVFPARRKYAT